VSDQVHQELAANKNDDFNQPQDIVITKLDRERIEKLLVSAKPDLNIEMLKAELDRATIVPSEAIPPNVVTMNSRVRFEDMTTKDETEFTLAYPPMANIKAGRVSILSPVGAALLGLKTGDEIEWPLPLGRKRTLRIISIPYQPEAQGNFSL
jgi:regulator of nucleoside diphosphate kinase